MKNLIRIGLVSIMVFSGPLLASEVVGVDIDSLKYRIANHKLNCEYDDFQPLSYAEFTDMRNNKIITNEQAENLIDYAYKARNPILYRKSDETIMPQSYSLNFLWIHKDKQTFGEKSHLMGEDQIQFQNKILNPIRDWQSKQPQVNINFWYDPQMIANEDSVIKTTKNELEKNGVCLGKVNFNSIRSINIVNDNKILFETDIAVYFRVDLAKALIADHVMRNHQGVKYVINIDCDISAVTCEHLFDQKTLDDLNGPGYIFGSSKMAPEENSFIILNKEFALEWNKKSVIDPAIKNALIKIKDGENPTHDVVFKQYSFFKPWMYQEHYERTGKDYLPICAGKLMIFPASQFGMHSGYTEQEIECLKRALH